MDVCFNRYIPKTKQDLLVIRPASKTFINGMAEAYSYNNYDEKLLAGALTHSEYDKIIEEINSSIISDYPCPGCQCFAYTCCLCTLGCSCIIPFIQVKKAIKSLNKVIQKINAALKPRKIKIEHKIEKSTSYILMYLPNHKVWGNNDNL